jgi:hypothetical protein
MEKGECPICKKWKDLSDEHVMAHSIVRRLKALGPFLAPDSTLEDTSRTVTYPEYTMKACERCNRRMGKSIEEPAIPLVVPLMFDEPATPETFTATQGKVIARWAVKVAALHAHSIGEPPWPVFYEWLNQPGRPPPPEGTSVWIGSLVPTAPNLADEERQILQPRLQPSTIWNSGFRLHRLCVCVLYEQANPPRMSTHPAEDLGYVVRVNTARKFVTRWPAVREVNPWTWMVLTSVFPAGSDPPSIHNTHRQVPDGPTWTWTPNDGTPPPEWMSHFWSDAVRRPREGDS